MRGPASGEPARTSVSIRMPPMNAAITPFVAVATLEMPMYRPADALGMMSVISAQSTDRKLPSPTPMRMAPPMKTGIDGAKAHIVIPTPAMRQAT